MAFNVNALGFGDNVVDRYEHIHTMYPGGNAVNFAVYAKKCGAARSAYMGIFGNDAAAEHVIASLEDEGPILPSNCYRLRSFGRLDWFVSICNRWGSKVGLAVTDLDC